MQCFRPITENPGQNVRKCMRIKEIMKLINSTNNSVNQAHCWAKNYYKDKCIEIASKTALIFHEEAGVKFANLEPDKSIIDDLNIKDPLVHVDVITRIEETFMLSIPDSDIKNLYSIDDIINYLTQNVL